MECQEGQDKAVKPKSAGVHSEEPGPGTRGRAHKSTIEVVELRCWGMFVSANGYRLLHEAQRFGQLVPYL